MVRKKYFVLGWPEQLRRDKSLLYRHKEPNKPNKTNKEGPLSLVLFESQFFHSFNSQQGPPLSGLSNYSIDKCACNCGGRKLYQIIYVDVQERTCYRNDKIFALKVMSTETGLTERGISRWILIKEWDAEIFQIIPPVLHAVRALQGIRAPSCNCLI